MTAPKLTAASMLTDSERPDWLEVVAVFEATPEQRAAFASLLHVEDGVRVTVEAADASASLRDTSHVEAIDHYREGLHRIWQGEADPCEIAACYLGEDPQPRDLAGRIRAMIQGYAGRFADADDLDQADALKEAIEDLRWAAHCARVNVPLANWIASMRRGRDRSSAHLAVLRQAADEIEAIVRECEEKR